MADTPDIWPDRWPEPPARTSPSAPTPVRPIGNRVPRFGVARELDAPRRTGLNGGPPGTSRPATPVVPEPPATDAEGIWTRLGTWWACREMHPVDLWHRMRCRRGRHQIEGGRQIQLGSRLVNTERCCVWCGHKPR